MRPTYANVASTLALVLALGGTGAYAAGKVTGKDIKNSSVTGKDVKNGSLTGADLGSASVGAGQLSPAVNAALAPAPERATKFDVTVPAGSWHTHQPVGQVAGVTLEVQCGNVIVGQAQFLGSLNAVLPAATAYVDGRIYRTGNAPFEEYGYRSSTSDGIVELAHTTNSPGTSSTAVGNFTLLHSSGDRYGTVYASADATGQRCRFTGWMLHG